MLIRKSKTLHRCCFPSVGISVTITRFMGRLAVNDRVTVQIKVFAKIIHMYPSFIPEKLLCGLSTPTDAALFEEIMLSYSSGSLSPTMASLLIGCMGTDLPDSGLIERGLIFSNSSDQLRSGHEIMINFLFDSFLFRCKFDPLNLKSCKRLASTEKKSMRKVSAYGKQ
jgi:hypothetical protein